MDKTHYFPFLLVLTLVVSSCNSEPPIGYIQTDGTRFIDAGGRTMLFNGVNVICKDPRKNYTQQFSKAEFDSLAAWGFNMIRFGIIWSGVEPHPGEYNEKYLEEVDQVISWATEAGLYVLLDMHQDLYGQKFSDGAPDWATLDGGLPHQTGAIWSDSYLISPAVQSAFDNFWANAHAVDGIGIQDHYIAMWTLLAAKYADNPMILGYDIMNEPFMGTQAQGIMPLMVQAYAHQTMDMEAAFMQGTLESDMIALANKWASEDGRLEILRELQDPQLYAEVIESAAGLSQQFDEGPLSSFYQRIRDSIRQVDNNHIIFLEHNYFCNTGIRAKFELPKTISGEPDPLLAYAAHGYDLVTDTRSVGDPSHARVELIFSRIQESTQRMNIPLLVGEWGAYGGDHPMYKEAAQVVMALFENMKCGQAYWNYDVNIAHKAYFPVLNRMYPMAVSGSLQDYLWNHRENSFYMTYKTTGLEKYPTTIFLPDVSHFDEQKLLMKPAGRIAVKTLLNSRSGFLIIQPDAFAGIRKIQYY